MYCFVPFSKSIWVLVSIPCRKEWLKSNKSTTNQILDNYMFHHVPLHCTHLPWNILFFSTWLVSHRHSCWIIGDGNHGFMMIYASTILQLGRCSWSWLEADKAFCTFLSGKGQDPGSSWAPRWKKTLRVWNNPPTPWNDQYIEHISWNIPPSKPWFRAGPIHCWGHTNWRNQEIPDQWLHPDNYEKWSLWTILCTTWGLSLGLPHCRYICCRNCILFVQLRNVGSRR